MEKKQRHKQIEWANLYKISLDIVFTKICFKCLTGFRLIKIICNLFETNILLLYIHAFNTVTKIVTHFIILVFNK